MYSTIHPRYRYRPVPIRLQQNTSKQCAAAVLDRTIPTAYREDGAGCFVCTKSAGWTPYLQTCEAVGRVMNGPLLYTDFTAHVCLHRLDDDTCKWSSPGVFIPNLSPRRLLRPSFFTLAFFSFFALRTAMPVNRPELQPRPLCLPAVLQSSRPVPRCMFRRSWRQAPHTRIAVLDWLLTF